MHEGNSNRAALRQSDELRLPMHHRLGATTHTSGCMTLHHFSIRSDPLIRGRHMAISSLGGMEGDLNILKTEGQVGWR